MNTRNLDVALRIAADLNGAIKDVDALEQKVQGIRTAGQNAAQGLNTATTATNQNAAAAKAATTAQTQLGAATQKTSQAQRGLALTAGELRNAQRQLPMQITDIVTGLASGQSVFMVAIQQGGQLRDTWGGIVPAGRALLGTLSPMVVGLTAGAAAFGLIAKAIAESQAEEKAFNDALLVTGNYVGATSAQLEGMVDTIAGLESVTQGGARDALLQVAASGRIAGDQLEMVATAAARMEAATGQSVDTTVRKFEEIARSPVEALLKLNETEHFLTEAQLERVRALIEEGREQDAAAEGARIYASRLDDIATASEAARPALSRLWREAKEGAAGAWEETKNFADFLAAAAEKYRDMPWYQKFGPAAGLNAVRALYQAEPTAPVQVPRVAGAVDSKAEAEREKARKKAQQEWDRLQESNLSKRQKLEAEIADIRKTGLALGKSEAEIQGQIAQAQARYKESLPKGRKGGKSEAQQDQEAAQRELENLAKQTALLGTLADGQKRVSEEARVRYETEQGAFRLASAATKQQLIDQAKLLDAKRAEREAEEERQREFDKTERAYQRLKETLETPVEAALGSAIEGVRTLNNALAKGIAQAPEYQEKVARIFRDAFTKAPEPRLPNVQGFGLVNDQLQIEDESAKLQKWYDEQLALLNQFRAKKIGTQQQWDQQELEIEAQHQAALDGLQRAQRQLQVDSTQAIFDSMASIARSAAGEQSKAYRVLFALSKGFAVAQAAIALATNVANASKVGFPQNLPLIAAAFAQGAQIAALISGANYAPQGYATGGRIVGPGTPTSDSVPIWASVDEHMIRAASATQPGARAFLDDFNERGMSALWDWAGRFAAGGPITAPAERGMRYADPAASPVNLQNDMSLYLLNDRDQLAEALAKHPKMRRAIVIEASENGDAIRASWGRAG